MDLVDSYTHQRPLLSSQGNTLLSDLSLCACYSLLESCLYFCEEKKKKKEE